jgi:pilus assembly protein CpaC
MRNIVKKVWGLALVGAAGLASLPQLPGDGHLAIAGGTPTKKAGAADAGPVNYNTGHNSLLRISSRDIGQTKGVVLGRNKSMLIELPSELRDVVVSNPEIMDAVVQSSNRVYLIGKKNGQSNAFFFDANGDQILTLEVVIEHDTAALDALYRRLLPGSNIKIEILNETLILTGSVRTPVDSNRAADIAQRFITTPDGASNIRHERKVINMLAVEGEDQVMLKVVVAEVKRTMLKQFGINLAANLTSGNFNVGLLTANALPLTAAAGLGSLPVPGVANGSTAFYNNGPQSGVFGNSGLTSA